MKRHSIKKLCCALMTASLLLSLPATAMAEPSSVTLDTSHQLVLYPEGSEGKNPDLFQSYTKAMMPGDQRSLTVELKNEYSQYMLLYLRAEDTALDAFASEDEKAVSDALLSKLELTVTLANGDVLYQGSADGKTAVAGAALNDGTDTYVLLGTLQSGAKSYLTVQVDVPQSLGNEFQETLAKVNWVFYADIYEPPKEEEEDKPTPPGHDAEEIKPGEKEEIIIPEEKPPLTNLEIPDEEIPLAPPDETIVIIPEGELPKTGGALANMVGNSGPIGTTVLILMGICILLALLYRRNSNKS